MCNHKSIAKAKSFRCDKSSINMAWMCIIENKCSTYDNFERCASQWIRTFKLFVIFYFCVYCYCHCYCYCSCSCSCIELNWRKRNSRCWKIFLKSRTELYLISIRIRFPAVGIAQFEQSTIVEHFIRCKISSAMLVVWAFRDEITDCILSFSLSGPLYVFF